MSQKSLFTPDLNRVVSVDSKNVVLSVHIETCNDLVITQDTDAGLPTDTIVPPTGDLHIVADKLTVRGPIKIPGGNISIAAREIHLASGTNGAAGFNVDGLKGKDGVPFPTIAASGGKGASGHSYKAPFEQMSSSKDKPGGRGNTGGTGHLGNPGGNGTDAGSIKIYCERFVSADSKKPNVELTLSACGGMGGTGGPGQTGGNGGTGGNGADGKDYIFGVTHQANTAGGKGGQGGVGGKGGTGGTGGKCGSIVVQCVEGANAKLTTLVEGGKGGQFGAGGKGGAKGKGGTGGSHDHEYLPEGGWVTRKADNGAPGVKGPDGVHGDMGKDAPNGKATVNTKSSYELIEPGFRSADTSSKGNLTANGYWQMMSNKMRFYFLCASDANPDGYKKAAEYGEWIQNVLSAYALENLDDKFAMQLFSTCQDRLANLQTKRNIFGKTMDWVPRASLQLYQKMLSDTLVILKDIESSYEAYFQANASNTDRFNKLSNTKDQITQHAKKVEAQISTLFADAEASAKLVMQYEQELPGKQKTLLDKINQFDKNVAQHIPDVFSLSNAQDLINIIQTLGFTPEAGWRKYAMIGSQVGQAGTDIAKSMSSVKTASGQSVNKSYLVSQMQVFGQDVSKLSEALTTSKNKIVESDPNAYKLIMDQSKFDGMISQYFSISGAKQAEQAMDDYVNTVTERNAQVLAYNAYWGAMVNLQTTLNSLKLQEDQVLSNMLLKDQPYLPVMTSYMTTLYQNALYVCIYQLYMMSRAVTFWSLEDCPTFSSLQAADSMAKIDSKTIESACTNILNQISTCIEKRGSETEILPSKDDQPGVQLELNPKTHAAVFSSLVKSRQAITFVEPPKKGQNVNENPFVGMVNIRINKLRAWVHLKNAFDKPITVVLTQMGREQIMASDGTSRQFIHDTVKKDFSYSIKNNKKEIIADADFGNSDPNATYTPIGPFAAWLIELPEDSNPDLDISSIDKITLDFHISYFPA